MSRQSEHDRLESHRAGALILGQAQDEAKEKHLTLSLSKGETDSAEQIVLSRLRFSGDDCCENLPFILPRDHTALNANATSTAVGAVTGIPIYGLLVRAGKDKQKRAPRKVHQICRTRIQPLRAAVQ